MGTCTETAQASSQIHGAASPYVDPEFEFNAPRFFDFQRLKDGLSSPSSVGDTYFDTSKVKELRTPIRSSGEEENEDTAQLQKDIQKVREAMQSEGEATSKRRLSTDVTDSPPSSPAHPEAQNAGGAAQALPEAAPPPPIVEAHEEATMQETCGKPGVLGASSADAMEVAEDSASADRSEDGGETSNPAAAGAGMVRAADSAAAIAAIAQPQGQKQAAAHQAPASRAAAADTRMQAQNEPAAASPSSPAAVPAKVAPAPAASSGATQGKSDTAAGSHSAEAPAPWPLHPAKPQGASNAAAQTDVEQPASVQAPMPKKSAPANLVTSWGARAPAGQLSSGLVASGKTSLVHSAGRAGKTVGAATARKENTSANTKTDAASLPVGMLKRNSEKASVSQKGGGAGSAKSAASAKTGAATKRSADLIAPAEAQPSKKRPRVGAASQHGSSSAAGNGKAAGSKSAAEPKTGQRSLTVPKSPGLGRQGGRTQQVMEAERPSKAQPAQKRASQAPARKRAITEAKTPQLQTAKRKRTADDTAAASLGQEEKEEWKPLALMGQEKEDWKPLALMVAEFEAATPARFNHGPRAVQYVPPPQPDPHASAAAPDLATDGRQRPSRFKPHEERELEEMSARPAFHALPINEAVLKSRGGLGVRPVPARPVTRSQTPKLATRTRAAAHSAPSQEPAHEPKQKRVAFDPSRLTVPQSPAFATRARVRAQGMQLVEPTEQPFTFKAQRAPVLGAKQAASRPQKHRQSSVPKPFQLSTDARGMAKRSGVSEAEPVQAAPAFHAAPVPKSLYQPAKLPAIPEARPTEQEAFRLLSEARHQQAMAEQEAEQRAEAQRARRKSNFKAAPPPRFPQPAAPARSERPATRALTPKLAVETRSAARAAFDAQVARNKRAEEVRKAANAAERAAEEARELKEYRSQLTFKARPMPEHAAGPQRLYVLPEPKMTIPLSPQLQTRSRLRLLR